MTGECVRCGAETDSQIGEMWICESCYQARSSCCPEFGPDDLTGGDGDEEAQGGEPSESPERP